MSEQVSRRLHCAGPLLREEVREVWSVEEQRSDGRTDGRTDDGSSTAALQRKLKALRVT